MLDKNNYRKKGFEPAKRGRRKKKPRLKLGVGEADPLKADEKANPQVATAKSLVSPRKYNENEKESLSNVS